MKRYAFALCLLVAASSIGAEEIMLPDWFEENRVQAHSEHGLAMALEMTPLAHAQLIRSLGASVLTRIYLTRDEGAWWPSSVGETAPEIEGRDFALEISRAVHAAGLRSIAYHRHMSDAWAQTNHPDWICRDPGGSPALEPRGKTQTVFILCMNSPYRQYVQTRLLELADREVDAIYFDSFHMPDICVCMHCQEKFRRIHGKDLPLDAGVGSPGYLEAAAFVNETMLETFREWKAAVQARHPETFFSIGNSRYPLFDSAHFDARLMAISDTVKTEFDKAFGGKPPQRLARDPNFAVPASDDQMALGWSISRDTAQGRPPLMWIPYIRTEPMALFSVAAAATYGCVASPNLTIRDVAGDAAHLRAVFASSFELGRRISPLLAGARPIPWAIIHIGEQSRNARLADSAILWQEVFAPVLGAMKALKERHLPWATIGDWDLERELPEAARVLILPWPGELSAAQNRIVERFEKRGGIAIRLDPRAPWSRRDSLPSLIESLENQLAQAGAPPVRATGPKTMHAVFYRKSDSPNWTVALANSWGWFRSTREPNPALNQETPPPPCEGVTIELPANAAPSRAFEAVSGQELPIRATREGASIGPFSFAINAAVEIEP